jgi:tetratricopeptide (TPR) repeat protein
MICFLTCRGYEFTITPLLRDSDAPRIFIIPYDEVLHRSALPFATYVFTDLDRLSIGELSAATRLFQRLRDNGCRVLNNPARVRTRFALLRSLYRNKLNPFNAYLVEEDDTPERFPVFVRIADEHSAGPLTDLIWDQETLERAIEAALEAGYPRRALIIIEYAAAPVRPGVFRKLSVFRVADQYVPHVCVHDVNWIIKRGKSGVAPMELYDEELEILRTNPFAQSMKDVFENAEIDYGRVDFGLVDDRPCVYEINTNPAISGPYHHPIPQRVESMELGWKGLLSALKTIDEPDSNSQVDVSGDSIAALSHAVKTYPLLSDAFLRMSKEHARRGDVNSAIQCAEAGMDQAPTNMKLIDHLSTLMAQDDRFQDAIDLINRAVELEPKNARLAARFSKLMATNDRLEEAIDLADRAIELASDNPEHFVLKARLLLTAKRTEEALSAVQAAISLQPSKSEYHQLLSQIQGSLGDITAAMDAANVWMELSAEDNKSAAIQRIKTLRAQRRKQELRTMARRVRRLARFRAPVD